MSAPSESDACLAAAHAVAGGLPLEDVAFPDQTNRSTPAVDLSFRAGDASFVLEHTLIESFPDQLLDDADLLKVLAPLEQGLAGRLPTPGDYDLVVHPRAIGHIRDPEAVRKRIVDWAIGVAPTLALGSPRTAPAHRCRATPPGVGFEVTLARWEGIDDGAVFVSRFKPGNLEQLRRERLTTALDRKCPKLQGARQGTAVTVLVLELRDLAIANAPRVLAALGEVTAGRMDMPDRVVLLDTRIDGRWWAWLFKDGPQLAQSLREVRRFAVTPARAVQKQPLW